MNFCCIKNEKKSIFSLDFLKFYNYLNYKKDKSGTTTYFLKYRNSVTNLYRKVYSFGLVHPGVQREKGKVLGSNTLVDEAGHILSLMVGVYFSRKLRFEGSKTSVEMNFVVNSSLFTFGVYYAVL